MHAPAARVVARGDPGGEQPGAARAEGDAAEGGAEDDERHDDDPPRGVHGPAEVQRGRDVADQQQPRHPGGGLQRGGHELEERLRDAGSGTDGADGAFRDLLVGLQVDAGFRRDDRHAFGERAQARVVIEVAHGHGGHAVTDAADEGGRRKRGAAQGEEIRVRAVDTHAEHVDPEFGQPRFGGPQPVGHAYVRQRPGQGLLVHFPGGADRQFRHDVDARHQRRGHGFGQALRGGVVVEFDRRVVQGDVADEHVLVCTGFLHGDGRVVDVVQGGDVGLDFAELDAPSADLDLVVHPPDEVEAVGLQADVVAGAVGAFPPHRGHGGIFFGVFFGVEVAGQAHAADHEFADLAFGDGAVMLVDDD